MPTTGTDAMNGLQVTGLGDLLVEGKYKLSRRRTALRARRHRRRHAADELRQRRLAVHRRQPADAARPARGARTTAGKHLARRERRLHPPQAAHDLREHDRPAADVRRRRGVRASPTVLDHRRDATAAPASPSFALDESPMEADRRPAPDRRRKRRDHARRRRRPRSRRSARRDARFFVSVGYAPDVRDTDGDGIHERARQVPAHPRGQGRLRGRRRLSRRRQRRRRRPRRRGQVPEPGRGPRRLRRRRRLPRARQRQRRHRTTSRTSARTTPRTASRRTRRTAARPTSATPTATASPTTSTSARSRPRTWTASRTATAAPRPTTTATACPTRHDKCPHGPEDKDGFQDDDGCPDLDNDDDGIADAQGQVPDRARDVQRHQGRRRLPRHRRHRASSSSTAIAS